MGFDRLPASQRMRTPNSCGGMVTVQPKTLWSGPGFGFYFGLGASKQALRLRRAQTALQLRETSIRVAEFS